MLKTRWKMLRTPCPMRIFPFFPKRKSGALCLPKVFSRRIFHFLGDFSFSDFYTISGKIPVSNFGILCQYLFSDCPFSSCFFQYFTCMPQKYPSGVSCPFQGYPFSQFYDILRIIDEKEEPFRRLTVKHRGTSPFGIDVYLYCRNSAFP